MDLSYSELAQVPFFQGLTEDELERFIKCSGAHTRIAKKREILSLIANDTKYVGLVMSGAVDVVREDYQGHLATIARTMPNELFGDSVMCNYATVPCISYQVALDSNILFLPVMHLTHTCQNGCAFHKRLITNLLSLVSEQNRQLMEKIEIISQKTLRDKIIAFLRLQARRQQRRYLVSPLGRVELAEYLCADRSALTRELAKMQAEGLIDYDRDTFKLLNVTGGCTS